MPGQWRSWPLYYMGSAPKGLLLTASPAFGKHPIGDAGVRKGRTTGPKKVKMGSGVVAPFPWSSGAQGIYPP